ncbi:SAVED domain-containing protein [Endozoicomonas sp.]|uniref:SAVED domain-containing protein n=1 Tax=Endozoicomonas sp. TaxID=1892382 RepID=UPI003AF63824
MYWERFKWLALTALRLKRTAYPKTKWGAGLCVLAMPSVFFSIGVLAVEFESGYLIDSITLTGQEASVYGMFLSAFLAIVGALLIYSEWNMTTRHTAKVFISAMPGVSNDFPDEVLDPTEKEFCRESVALGVPQGRKENIEEQVVRYNAELEVDIFKRFILHGKCQRVYMGGLARVPFMLAYGALLRNVSAEIIYFDKFHKQGKWSLLDDENKSISLTEVVQPQSSINASGDAGIAIGLGALSI